MREKEREGDVVIWRGSCVGLRGVRVVQVEGKEGVIGWFGARVC